MGLIIPLTEPTTPLSPQSLQPRRTGNRQSAALFIHRWLAIGTALMLINHSVGWILWWNDRNLAVHPDDGLARALIDSNAKTTWLPDEGNSYLMRPTHSRSHDDATFHTQRNSTVSLVDDLSRAFDWIPSLPCFEPENRWFGPKAQNTPTTQGLLFAKPFKTASSTAVGVHLRIAKNLAMRRNASHDICQARFDHSVASQLFPHRDRRKSFLWTVLRDPSSRAVSQFFHFVVGRHHLPPSDAGFRFVLDHDRIVARNYYLYILTLERGRVLRNGTLHVDPEVLVRDALRDYDFVALTERFDESLVALQMLVADLSLADVLYLSAKHGGGYDDGGGKRQCTHIPRSHVTPDMERYLQSSAWKAKVRWDELLHRAANRSLDRTIDERLGRADFDKQLATFRRAQQIVQERCLPRAVFPCSESGMYNPATNCIWNDSGCGNDCLNEVATELDLW